MATLLIVDDSPDTCDMLARLLRRAGHAASAVYDGGEVLPLMRAMRFDLVILDVMMPDVDGMTVLGQIRTDPDPVTRSTPVAMYTAIGDPDARARAVELGANEWIAKGTPFAAMRPRLEACLAGAAVA